MRKKLFFRTLILSACLLAAGCDLDRPPLNGPETGNFPASEEEALLGLFGAYKGLSLMTAANTPWILVIDNSTDIGFTRPGNNYTPQLTSSLSADNTLTTKLWEQCYKTIGRVHVVLDQLPNIKGSSKLYDQIDAELRVIRAYYYSHLIEFYGDVPLVTKNLSIEDAAQLRRTPKAEVTQWLIDELSEVADHLPVKHIGYGTARAGRVAAYMLLARIQLYDKRYDDAAQSAAKAIELAQGVYELDSYDLTHYADHTQGEPSCANVFGYEGHKNSKEWIWCIQYNKNIESSSHQQGYYMSTRLSGGCSYFGPTQGMMDSFQCLDGKSIAESPLFDLSHPWENRDPRLDLFTVRPASRYFGYEFQTSGDSAAFVYADNTWKKEYAFSYHPNPNTPSGYVGGVPNQDYSNNAATPSGYLWRKHTDILDLADNRNCDLNSGILRYAELLLIYAEAKIEGDDIDESVYKAIDDIRFRAGMPTIGRGLTQSQLRSALRYERKIELCNEGRRWYDIRRWRIAENIMVGRLWGSNKSGISNIIPTFDENYSPTYPITGHNLRSIASMRFDPKKDYVWPVPHLERLVMPNLDQNYGY
ncbi:MAG: RagB/SusD family nutrient uptake outer membrane protein [Dysgonamonadaceae bacterium]|jgi:hypothetical protein|nr:RagB/SusD family nutrient uptake outer membrane protein [Dysgonamonadaceae bacterium]